MTSESCSWLDRMLDRYQEEKHALPQDVQQFLAFVRNHGGSLAYSAAKQLLAQKAVTATQHDVSRSDSSLQLITGASRSPYYFNAICLAASNEELDQENEKLREESKELRQENSCLATSNEELDQENKKLREESKELRQDNSCLAASNEELDQENKKLREESKELRQENSCLAASNEELDRENKNLREESKELRQENSCLAASNEELDQENKKLREESKELRQENSQLQQKIQELRVRQAVAPGMLSPAERETVRWLQEELPWWIKESTEEQRKKPVAVPVFALRFTHCSVNASLAFGEEHGNAQENILKLYEQMFRGRVKPSEIEPLVVKLPEFCGDDLGIRSRNNRRLLALRMLQGSRLDECLKVPCNIYTHRDYRRKQKFREWFDRGDDKTNGWSIKNREGKSKHRGVAIFNNADAAVKGLENLVQRASKKDLPNEHGISLVEALLRRIKRRPVGRGCDDDDDDDDDDEETLTFASVEDHGSRSHAA